MPSAPCWVLFLLQHLSMVNAVSMHLLTHSSCASSLSRGVALATLYAPLGMHCGMNEWIKSGRNEWMNGILSPEPAARRAPWVKPFLALDSKVVCARSATKPQPNLGFTFLSGTVSLHFGSSLSLWGEDFLSFHNFPFILSWPLFPSAGSSLPAVDCQSWLMPGEWLLLMFLCWCWVSRFKFHLIPREGPGCRLEPPAQPWGLICFG